jgi:hypothetical protein
MALPRSSQLPSLGRAFKRAAKGELDFAPGVLSAAIPEALTFREWCEGLAKERVVDGYMRPGLKVDGRPFKLEDRPALAWIYDQVPSTKAEMFRGMLILRKCAQVGFTVLEMLATIYLALKFDPLKLGMFLPDMNLARGKSSERFMPILRTVPEAYERLTQEVDGSHERAKGEGNVMIRRMGGSLFHFLWTSGRSTTESYPMDVITFDEVQEMLIADMEKAQERLSASEFKFTIMGSTANWPDADIDYWYRKGSQHRFHTRCPTCGVAEPMDDYFPACIKHDPKYPDRVTGVPGDYRYVCRAGHWIDEPQDGEWLPDNPDAVARKIISIHFHQMLSPTISPREMWEAYQGADDMKNFFNRKLGKPYQDPTQIPVTLEHLNKAAAEGMRRGVVWKKRARGTFMGIDQMGAFNVVLIKERLEDGRQALVHAEFIYDPDPFARCDQLMEDYGVTICVAEQLPNFNDAWRFSNRHPGRVFLCNGYGSIEDDMIKWGDAPRQDVSERRTEEEEQTRFTVRIDQYKAMQAALKRITDGILLFPDPQALVQEIHEKEARIMKPLLKDVIFLHFQKVALVTERIDPLQRKLRRSVQKVGIDPHAAFANMLCDVAWARAHGTSTFMLPPVRDLAAERREKAMSEIKAPGLPPAVVGMMEARPVGRVCGRCEFYPLGPDGPPASAKCPIQLAITRAIDPGCPEFELSEGLGEDEDEDAGDDGED